MIKSGASSTKKHSAAAASVMNPVLEDVDAEGEGSSSLGDQKGASSTGGDSPHQSSSESFSLARQETKMIKYSKILLLFVILVVATVVSLLTYKLIKDQEYSVYNATFYNIATEVKEFSQLKANYVVNNMERLCAHITSTANATDQTWPQVVIPDFQVKGMLTNQETGAHTLSINPLVFPHQLEEWANFSVSNQDWIEQAHEMDRVVHEELYVLHHYDNHDDSTEENHEERLSWNVTGITPYVWTTDDGEKGDASHERIPVTNSALYAPVWQRAPASDFYPLVNYDLHSSPTLGRHIDGMLAVNHPVISQIVDATYLETNYEHRFDPQELAEPHSYLLEIIYDSLTTNRTAVAVLAGLLRWGTFFTDVLPSSEEGIFVVVESSCNQTFTYEIFGHSPVYLGNGDRHAKRLDADHLEVTFEFSPETALEKGGKHQFCHYYAHVFPSQEWKDKFFTNRPYTFAAGVFCCFLATTIVFLMYDLLVQRRQKKVMSSAKRTNAIVNSLFPSNIRDRLLEDIDKGNNDKPGNNRTAWGDPSNTFARANAGSPHLSSHARQGLSSESIFGSKPIADLFPATTIMFADMVGFTAWSSVREPSQVFSLLETVYHSFDMVAKRRRVFKVETVGDCYVACAGLPIARKDHAVVMAKFSTDCMHKMKELVHKLETTLGPDTADLDMRIGLHSGPVTAGVLRGDKGRFQLFGDTMNTASRLESTGDKGRIHISRETAELLVAAGKEKWVTLREEQVFAKGKGTLQTYWVRIHAESSGTGTNSNLTRSSNWSDDDSPSQSKAALAKKQAMVLGPTVNENNLSIPTTKPKTVLDDLPDKQQRLVKWNADMLLKILVQIMARRASLGTVKPVSRRATKKIMQNKSNVLDEVKDVLALPQFDAKIFQNHVDPQAIEVPDIVVDQLTDVIARIASLYRDNPFHNFEHASHVTMSVTKLLSRIVNPNEVSAREGASNDQIAANLHDHTFGITSDPLTQFACIISALIHDADHPGVPNATLVKEEHPLASKYNGKSVAEQNSVDLAWDIIMSEEYKELQACICGTKDELERFRSIIVNVVMATDIMDKDLGAQRKARWEKAFSQELESGEDNSLAVNRKATIVLEHLMQASDIAHTMQHWVVYCKWNERLFQEMYRAYVEGRSERDPSEGWYKGEIGFFDYYIIPLAKKLETCGVFGVSSHEYLSYAQANRREWEAKGEQLVKDYLWRFHNAKGEKASVVAPVQNSSRADSFQPEASLKANQTSLPLLKSSRLDISTKDKKLEVCIPTSSETKGQVMTIAKGYDDAAWC